MGLKGLFATLSAGFAVFALTAMILQGESRNNFVTCLLAGTSTIAIVNAISESINVTIVNERVE
jgi:hypothetical protein